MNHPLRASRAPSRGQHQRTGGAGPRCSLGHAALCIGLLASAAALAQETLPDPTRPPAGLQAAGSASAPVLAETLVLQSVLLGKGRAPAAIINGRLVPLGGRVGDLRLAAVTERSAQLRGPQGATTLRLTPDAQKQTRAPHAAARKPLQGGEPTK